MRLSKKKAKTIESAINSWVDEEVITQNQARVLRESYEIAGFDWNRLAKYSFWISIVCIVISVSAIISDKYLMDLIARIFDAPEIIKALGSALIATLLFYFGLKRKTTSPEKIFSTEAIFFLGVIAVAISIAFLGRAIDTGSGHFSLLLLLAAIIYGILGLWIPSKLVWVFSLLSIGSWMGAETGYVSGWAAYYLGMNYPLRFVIFGIILLCFSGLLAQWQFGRQFYKSTKIMGLLDLFIALWFMSIFGNYGDIHEWEKVKQIELIHWSLIFGIVALTAIYYGIKNDDGMIRVFGITFLFINLYTRFFELFWTNIHKAIFFTILAASFWYLGARAEKIWNLGRIPSRAERKNEE